MGAARTITPELKETGALTVSADLSTAEGVTALLDSALTELGGIDLLVKTSEAEKPSPGSSRPMTPSGPASSTSTCSAPSAPPGPHCPA
ncbi:hypothetical protein SGFS_052310 [Streptomyces graminofaciens]|jgi:hypothetical protein|uniref:Uncharacterized protein n=1 Tax=Streptomyces graminofaciens TaxID=68212 RepID=A0ABN5VKN1_9ACTN|nr:hypothetical protein SGFS_052310 [Streptomyces graminofaciens]